MTAAAEIPQDIRRAAEECVIHLPQVDGFTRKILVGVISAAILADRQRDPWQDIHDAPRDGTKVLCFSPGNRRAIYAEPRHAHFCVDEYRGEGRSGFYKMWPEAPYTHWQPLPAAPRGGAE